MNNAELNRFVVRLEERAENARRTLESVDIEYRRAAERADQTRREVDLLSHRVSELEKWRDERSRRFWSFGPALAGAIVGGLITACVAYLNLKR